MSLRLVNAWRPLPPALAEARSRMFGAYTVLRGRSVMFRVRVHGGTVEPITNGGFIAHSMFEARGW